MNRAAVALAAWAVALAAGSPLRAQDAGAAPAPSAPTAPAPSAPEDDEPRGLRLREPGAFEGWTLFGPLNSRKVHLVDLDGQVVHTWETAHRPGGQLMLLENGHLLRAAHKEGVPRFEGGGIGGLIQELGWDGEVLWQYELSSDQRVLHHDFKRLPNGNLLVIAWEAHEAGEAYALGRDPGSVPETGLWPDVLYEVRPTRPQGGEIVWTWRTWDHLVQDRDPAQPNYGALREHPGRIDINAGRPQRPETEEERQRREELDEQMRALGYVGGGEPDAKDAPAAAAGATAGATPAAGPPPGGPRDGDWLHTNAVDYLPELDLIVLSTPRLSELWVIDHDTTTAEAATSSGGRRRHGGDLLWRWGNPAVWGQGGEADQMLFAQHDARWLPGTRPGELRMLVFNNGLKRPGGGEYSSVEELVLPFDSKLGFVREENARFGPAGPAWSYSDTGRFYSAFISGAQRLPNGNTLICEGAKGRIFEITADGRIVWDFLNPLGGEAPPSPQGGNAPPKALFRATRIAADHPGVKGRL
jgi:hypothetical protein